MKTSFESCFNSNSMARVCPYTLLIMSWRLSSDSGWKHNENLLMAVQPVLWEDEYEYICLTVSLHVGKQCDQMILTASEFQEEAPPVSAVWRCVTCRLNCPLPLDRFYTDS